MAEKKNQLLKITLMLTAILTLVYGVIYLIFPEFEIKMNGGEPIPTGWIRWVGGLFIVFSIGSFMAFRNPAKQGIFVTALCIGSLVAGLALFYEVIFKWDSSFNLANTLGPAILFIIMSLLFWLSLRQSKEILW